jgi:acyl carrier protein
MTVCELIERETEQPVNEETPLSALEMDSLEFVEMLSTIEAKMGKRISDDLYPKLKTVGDIVRALA